MLIERYIFKPSDLENDYASIQLYIYKSIECYTLHVIGISLNDGMFCIKIENVKQQYLEKACTLVLNTLHLYWMPMYVYKDFVDSQELSSDSFNNIKETEPEDNTTWLIGKINILHDSTLSFEWERPPHNMYDDGTHTLEYDLYFEESIQYRRQSNDVPPIGFKYPCI
jgi:hypothetical protein